MAGCEDVRAQLYRFAEGEAEPGESLAVARHLPDCTACKILLARERRLAQFLEHDLQDLPVGDEFVEGVMAQLPEEPPAPPRKRSRWSGLKLAGLAGLVFAPGFLAAPRLELAALDRLSPLIPRLDLESAQATLAGLLSLIRLALLAASSQGGLIPQWLRWSPGSLSWVGVTALALIVLSGAAAMIALAAGSLIRRVS